MIKRIISGGQTGADQAALDAAIEHGFPHGGWIPKERRTEDGPLPEKYQMKEIDTSSYPKRTELNVKDSDGTLIFSHGRLTGGSALTKKLLVKKYHRPCLRINLNVVKGSDAVAKIRAWIEEHDIEILNVAGSRASKDPEMYDKVRWIIESLISGYITGLKVSQVL